MKSIHTLIPDIYSLVSKDGESDARLTTDHVQALSTDLSLRLGRQFGVAREDGSEGANAGSSRTGLRLSQMGPRCSRALWYSVHHPELGEALPPWAEVKYAFGHIIEALAIALAKAAGHTVTGEQDVVQVDGIVGHRDCVLDGAVCDVKSTSSRSFQKFKDKSIGKDDPFGYLEQLDGYVVGSYEDPLVTVKDKGYLLAIDKTLGHMVLYEHIIREAHIRQRIAGCKSIVALPTAPPCTCGTVEHGKSGNIKLDTKASYSAFKFSCFPRLRTFLYSDGPVYLTHVERKPDVPEIDRYGQIKTGG